MARYIVARGSEHNPGKSEFYALCQGGHHWVDDPRNASAWDNILVPGRIALRYKAYVENCADLAGEDWPCDFCGAPMEHPHTYCSKSCAGMDAN